MKSTVATTVKDSLKASTLRPIGKVDERKNKKIAQCLNEILANEFLLYTKTLNFHWNFKGTRFASMHRFLEEQYNDILAIMDNIAERVKILDEVPLSTAKEMVDKAFIHENPGFIPNANEMIAMLLSDHHAIQDEIKVYCSEPHLFTDDPGTEDLLIETLRQHERMSWKLKSSLG
ncbi:MAG: DNA starvation/stationary phase protection protein [Halobacteriovoraceae bacterium]|nr:DNA starvation/stationary phase protection protein [Halobacteriovoraceae bacterium]